MYCKEPILCYVMLCYVMLCYVMLCYVMLCYVMLCYVMLCYIILYYIILYCNARRYSCETLNLSRANYFVASQDSNFFVSDNSGFVTCNISEVELNTTFQPVHSVVENPEVVSLTDCHVKTCLVLKTKASFNRK